MNIEQKQSDDEQKTETSSPDDKGSRLKNIGLFIASPFIAIGYSLALPFVGMYLFSKEGFGMFQSDNAPEEDTRVEESEEESRE